MGAARRIVITAGSIRREATLNTSPTADAIRAALPIEAPTSRWGDEIYFEITVDLESQDGRAVVRAGDLGYWPPGKAFCIFWAPTPASRGHEIRPAGPVNVFGRIVDDPTGLGAVRAGELVRIERQPHARTLRETVLHWTAALSFSLVTAYLYNWLRRPAGSPEALEPQPSAAA